MIYRGLEITKNKKEYLIYNGDMLLKILSTKDHNIDDVYNLKIKKYVVYVKAKSFLRKTHTGNQLKMV